MVSTHTHRVLHLLWALSALAAALPAGAEEPAGDGTLRLSGYGTFGLASIHGADGWRFRRETIQPADNGTVRADVDTRLGLQANWQPDPHVELVGQLVLKHRPPAAPASESIAWAFAAWTPTPDWTLRLGRTSPDVFLLADYRDVGFAYPWVRPPTEFYGWMPVSAMDGIDVARNWDTGSAHWRAKLFAGHTDLTLPYIDGDTRVKGRLVGGTLTREAQGFTVKASYALAHNQPADVVPLQQFFDALASVTRLPVPSVASEAGALLATIPSETFITHYTALGASWDLERWQLQAEFARIGGNFTASNNRYGYLSAAYRATSAVSVYAIGSWVRPLDGPQQVPQWQATLTPLVGPQLAGMAQQLGATAVAQNNSGRQDQRTASLGLRWDVAARTALKLQWDDIQVEPLGSGLWYGGDEGSRHVRVFSGTVDFVF